MDLSICFLNNLGNKKKELQTKNIIILTFVFIYITSVLYSYDFELLSNVINK